ncbi:methyl-accepting chemotaxis protein [Candidatus Magnetomoraceae bacterium gMMP-15]
MFKDLTIRTKMLVFICSVAFIAFAVTITFIAIKSRNTAKAQALDKAQEIAHRYSVVVKSEIEIGLDAARTLAQTFEGIKNSNNIPERKVLDAVLKQILIKNPSFVGIWTCWEPNALDGRDKNFVNAAGHDSTGRYIPYWNRGGRGGEIIVEPAIDYEKEGAGDYYLLSKRSGKEIILDPYPYIIGGKKLLITSVVAPIKHNGVFVGVAGVDITLTFFQDMIPKIRPFKTGYAGLISNGGFYVAHLDSKRAGKAVGTKNLWPEAEKFIKRNETFIGHEFSSTLKQDVQRIYVPINIGKTDTPWAFLINMPLDRILAEAYELMYFSMIIGAIALAVFITVIVFIANNIASAVNRVVNFSDKVKAGDSKTILELNRKDEIGMMADALNDMVLNQRKMLNNLNRLPASVAEIDKNFNIVYVNDMAAKLTGLTPDECVGKKCYDLFQSEDCKTDRCVCKQAMKENKQVSNETRINPGNISNIPVSYTGIPVYENEKVVGALEIIFDQSMIYNIVNELRGVTNELNSSSEGLSTVSSQMASASEEMNGQAATVAAAAEEISTNVTTVASASEQSSTSISQIAAMTEEMSSTFQNLAKLVRKTAVNVEGMAGSGIEMSANVDNVAISISEMSSSLSEVAANTAQASSISKDANDQALGINAKMKTLASASKQIGKVIAVIKDIADQTNMLALNAAIEAAGAGEAGKGFAVVASEVKELAKQSADASDEITEQIESIQNSTNDAVEVVDKINTIINQIAGINESIASAVEEQTTISSEIADTVNVTVERAKSVSESANESSDLVKDIANSTDEVVKTANEVATHVAELAAGSSEIAQSSGEVAIGVQDVSKNIQSMSLTIKDTAKGANKASESSKGLSAIASHLMEIVNRFKL